MSNQMIDNCELSPLGVGVEAKEPYVEGKAYMVAWKHYEEGFIGWFKSIYMSDDAQAMEWEWEVVDLAWPSHIEEATAIKVCEIHREGTGQ